ncbi:glycosyltransferase [Candidatus Saccharibacteria bacterium]|nr:glycosyltransferase [Candidatus Saccharibacteria bacterium]
MEKSNVFLIRNVAGGGFGGGEIYQLELAKRLGRKGFHLILVTNSKKLAHGARLIGVEVLESPYLDQQNWSGWRNILLPRYWIFQWRLEKWYENIFREYKPVAVNVQSRDDMIAVTKAARKIGIRVLWTDHADFKNWVLWNVNKRFKNTIGKKIVKMSTEVYKVIFVSEEIKKITTKMIRPEILENIEVISNGVGDEKEKYVGVCEKKNSFVFVGRVVEEKGIGELIDAFKNVSKIYPEAILNVYGDGDLEGYKKRSAGCGKIHFHGRTEESLKVIAENEVFVLPSYREGLSLSLLDAAMMGKRIIASNVDGNPEVVVDKETGLLVPARNASKLAEAMIWMLENRKEAGKMAKNARKRYEENFDFDKIFEEKMLPLYKTKE